MMNETLRMSESASESESESVSVSVSLVSIWWDREHDISLKLEPRV